MFDIGSDRVQDVRAGGGPASAEPTSPLARLIVIPAYRYNTSGGVIVFAFAVYNNLCEHAY